MNSFEFKNSIEIQNNFNNLNLYLAQNSNEIIVLKIESYESIKINFHRNKYFIKIFTPFFYLIRRLLPNLFFFNKIGFFRKKRVLSLPEILGRIIYAGFEIEDFCVQPLAYEIKCFRKKEANKEVYRNEGPIIKLERIGKNGNSFYLYKFRTMHPYAEFIQDLMLRKNGFAQSGKIQNDIRLTKYGRIIRKFYLDELPQLYNFFKGDLKLVGVRPISRVFYTNISDELKEYRRPLKPACIPPYVSEGLKPSLENVRQSELRYILEYQKNPIKTDFIYFWKAIFNILFKFIRSQ
jgi:hypothetical protein